MLKDGRDIHDIRDALIFGQKCLRVAVVDANDKVVGEVTSGTVSPTLGKPVMLAMLDSEVIRESGNTTLRAVVRDRRPAVHLTPLPFVPKRYKR